jgi:muconolactone delta-isomerase
MRTLVIVETGPVGPPPEALLPIIDAFKAWRERWRSKMEVFEFFAGRGGGWAVFNTTDEEELSQIMMEFPFAPFALIQVHPTANGDKAMGRLRETTAAMLAAMGGS